MKSIFNYNFMHMTVGAFLLGVILHIAGLNISMPAWWAVVLYVNAWYATKPNGN